MFIKLMAIALFVLGIIDMMCINKVVLITIIVGEEYEIFHY